MLQSDKPSQAKAIQGWVQPSSTQIPQDVSYIYDGGNLGNLGTLLKKDFLSIKVNQWMYIFVG